VIETAREQVAELIGAHPMDVIFTSCATEAIEVYGGQLTAKAFSVLTVNCKLWTVNYSSYLSLTARKRGAWVLGVRTFGKVPPRIKTCLTGAPSVLWYAYNTV
jgi:hypothetical protein